MKKQVSPQISAICPNDFGLKAGFLDRDKGGKITFKPIVGWVSVINYVESGRLPFVAVVMNDDGFPSMAADRHLPNFVGHFDKAATAAEAQKIIDKQGVSVRVRGAGRPLE
jgi:hypothetical protein